MWSWCSGYVYSAVISILFVLIVSVMARLVYGSSTGRLPYSPEYTRKVKEVARQALLWIQTAEQDTNPVIAAQHYANALAYLEVCSTLVNEDALDRIMQTSYHDLKEKVKWRQLSSLRHVNKACPEIHAGDSKLPLHGWL